jgi:hypothetical protein
MAGYLDTYGVADERRGRIVRRVAVWSLSIVVVSALAYFYFRTWREERVVKQFLAAIAQQDFQGAYKMFGCTQDTPCRYYPPDQFTQDWGPSTPYANASAAKIDNIDYCDAGVVFSISYPKAEPVSLWVETSSRVISFAPWPRCPGRHWQFRQFIRGLFASKTA